MITPRTAASALLSVAALLAACGDDNLYDLKPKLAVEPGTPTDSGGHYLLDFGAVDLGNATSRSILVTNIGREKLTLQPSAVPSPFSPVITSVETIAPGNVLAVAFTFTPANVGPDHATVTLESDGGTATVDLEGSGVSTPPPSCTYLVAPQSIPFGTIDVGQTLRMGVHLTNTGSGTCAVTDIKLAGGSDPAFQLAPGQVTSGTIAAASGMPIGVTFAPTAGGTSFQGTLTFAITPGTVVEVPLSGAAMNAPACTFTVAPGALAFSSTAEGQTKTEDVTVKATGSTACDFSSVAIASGSASAFALAAGQATSGSVSGGSTATVGVAFAPNIGGSAFQGSLDLTVSGSPVTVPLTGSSPVPCPDPNPDGTCGTATAFVYANTSSALYTFDVSTHQLTRLTDFSVASMLDIAIDNTGAMFGVDGASLYTINVGTGACTAVASINDSANGLTISPDNQIVLAGDDVELFDRTTYALIKTLVPSGTYTTSGDIVALPDGFLYWTVEGFGNDQLVKVDPNTGDTTLLGTLPASEVYGLSYAAGTLWGFSDLEQYVVIDPANASGTVGASAQGWFGATSNPVTW